MFGRFIRPRKRPKIATQPVGEIFPWPKNTTLRPLDRLTLALPVAILEKDELMSDVIHADDDVEIAIPEGDDKVYLRMQAGLKISLSKSVQAIVLPWVEGETNPKRVEILD